MLNNPMFQFINMMQNAQNPEALFKQRYGNDPAYSKVMNARNGKSEQEFREYVINTCKSKGHDPKEYLSQFGIQI